MSWLIQNGLKPEMIQNGNKILCLEIIDDYNIRFIDSICFTLCSIKDFPKTFALEKLAKGYFPHKVNLPENQNYIGTYPDEEYYGYSSFTQKAKKKILIICMIQ